MKVRKPNWTPERLRDSSRSGWTSQKAELALDALERLSERLRDAGTDELPELLRAIVVRIKLEFTHTKTASGKRTRSRLTGGRIAVRPDRAVSLLFGTASGIGANSA